MRNLWVFADSYGVHIEQATTAVNNWFWAYQLAKKLKCNFYYNQSQMGVCNDYIQYVIMENADKITPDDYVIVISTSIIRKWFIKDKPWLSNFYVNNILENTSAEFVSAVRQYVLHLYNSDAEKLNFHQFLGWLHYTADKKQWNMLVIPGFEGDGYPISHRYQVAGSLYNVSSREFLTPQDTAWYYDSHCIGRDNRSGHLLKINHEILAEKIFNTFTNNSTLDLNCGFEQKIISKDTINQILDQFPELDLSATYVKGYIPTV